MSARDATLRPRPSAGKRTLSQVFFTSSHSFFSGGGHGLHMSDLTPKQSPAPLIMAGG